MKTKQISVCGFIAVILVFFGCSSSPAANAGSSDAANITEGGVVYNSEKTILIQADAGITEVAIPESVTKIGDTAFFDCAELREITIPANVTRIGANAFSYCTGLNRITIPSGLTHIGREAFSGCAGLREISIPASVTNVGKGAFANLTSAQTINILGFANQAEADRAWNIVSDDSVLGDWRKDCGARINYRGR